MKTKKMLVDTTLRDGEQCPGVAFRPEDKIEMALFLDQIGVYEIEIGVFVKECEGSIIGTVMEQRENARISVWSRLVEDDVEYAASLQPDLIHIGVPISYTQIYGKLRKNKDWLKNQVGGCLEVALKKGIPVTVGFEDASRADIGFMINMAKFVNSYGVETIRLADTVGSFTPSVCRRTVKDLLSEITIQIETHEHNDLGMAVANTIAMLKEGAQLADCTLLGLGERAGNCDMLDLIRSTEYLFDFGVRKSDVKIAEEKLINIIQA